MTNKTPNRFEIALETEERMKGAYILGTHDEGIKHSNVVIEALKLASDLHENPYGGTPQEPFEVNHLTATEVKERWSSQRLNEAIKDYLDMEPVTAWRRDK